jgi:F0F1-type ATP synthase assembly protein I
LSKVTRDKGWETASSLSDIGLRFSLVILLSVYGGYKLDQRFDSLPWFTLIAALLGFAVAFYWMLMRLKDFSKRDES